MRVELFPSVAFNKNERKSNNIDKLSEKDIKILKIYHPGSNFILIEERTTLFSYKTNKKVK